MTAAAARLCHQVSEAQRPAEPTVTLQRAAFPRRGQHRTALQGGLRALTAPWAPAQSPCVRSHSGRRTEAGEPVLPLGQHGGAAVGPLSTALSTPLSSHPLDMSAWTVGS